MGAGEREPLHETRGWAAWADFVQRAVSSFLRIGGVRFAARRLARLLRAPWSILQRVPVEGDFTVRIGGQQIIYRSSLYDAVGRKLFWGASQDYEPETVQAITERLRGGIFLDVGANTGFFSLVAAGFDAAVVCHAFEPAPRVFAALQANVRANGLSDRIICRPLAVAATGGAVRLHIPERNWSSACLRERGFRDAPGHLEEVASVSLDDYVAAHDLRPVTVIKIDVEGFEHLVLQGARKLLATQRPAVICECLPESDTTQMSRLLRQVCYAAFSLTGKDVRRASAIAPDPAGQPRNFLLLPLQTR